MMEKKSVITVCTDAFAKFVSVAKKQGFMAVSYSMLLFLVFYTLVINPININGMIERRDCEEDRMEREAYEKRLAADEMLMPVLDGMVEENAMVDRALIFELHNGVRTKGHLDMLFMSVTFESISTGRNDLEPIGDMFQRQPISSMFSGGIGSIRFKRYAYYSLEGGSSSDSRLLKKMARFGVKNLMLVPVLDDNDVPIVLIAMAGDKEFDAYEEYLKLKPHLSKLKCILMN